MTTSTVGEGTPVRTLSAYKPLSGNLIPRDPPPLYPEREAALEAWTKELCDRYRPRLTEVDDQ